MTINVLPSNGPSGYNLTKSLRLRSSASARLTRTFGAPTNNIKWTLSAWVKRGAIGSSGTIVCTGTPASGNYFMADFSADSLDMLQVTGGTVVGRITSNAVYRDPAAWYHVVFVWDSANATAANRMLMYVNGVQITSFSTQTNPSSSLACSFNTAASTAIGYRIYNSDIYFDGYLAEMNFIDGQALTPSSFGSTNSQTGVWQPVKYTGTYGNNGFYLPFTDVAITSGSNAGLGKDFSGNGNYFNTTNISVTAGGTYDSMSDVATLTSATTANYCVMNPLGTTSTIINGNLQYSGGTTFASATMFPTSGKFYAEVVASGTFSAQGIAWGFASGNAQFPNTATPGAAGINGTWFVYSGGGLLSQWVDTGSGANTSNPFTVGTTWQLAIDATNGYAWLGQNNTWYSSTFTATGNPATGANPTFTISSISTRNGIGVLCGLNTTGGTFTWNFGAGNGFTYTPPTGFGALNTYNLPTPTIGATASTLASKNFDINLYNGTGASQSITNAQGFQPSFIWLKCRGTATDNIVHDVLRGTNGINRLFTQSTAAESTTGDGFLSINSNGFSLDSTGTGGDVNTSGRTYVAWQWAGPSSGTTNTSGSITSTVAANTSAGFSVVKYTGNGSSGATIGHGLGIAPQFLIVKSLGIEAWATWHTSYATSTTYQRLYTSDAVTTAANWMTALPTSSVVTMGNGGFNNTSGVTYIMYCWAEVPGYSKFGSYVGNGSTDGIFLHTGFKPKYVMVKRTDIGGDWRIHDGVRNPYNAVNSGLWSNIPNIENTTTGYNVDFISNGFKYRNANADSNAAGGSYIYMAFAENPFKYSLAR